jgi:hypothetical protein
LTRPYKKYYNTTMPRHIVLFLLRLLLTLAIFGLVWTAVRPRTQSLRILRAALLVLCLLVVLAALRGAGLG